MASICLSSICTSYVPVLGSNTMHEHSIQSPELTRMPMFLLPISACKEGDEFTLTNDEAALRAAFNGTDLEWHDEMKQMLGRRYVLKKQSDAPPGTCLLPYKDDKSWLFPFSAATSVFWCQFS